MSHVLREIRPWRSRRGYSGLRWWGRAFRRCVSNLAALADAAGERSDVTHCYSRSNGTDLIAGDFGSSAGECAFGISAILMGRKRGHH